MSNSCQRPAGWGGVPVGDSDESFPEMGMRSISGQRELLLSWDQQLRGVRREPLPPLLRLLSPFTRPGTMLSCWGTVIGLQTFCCLTQVLSGGRFSSATLHLLLWESTSGLFWLLWPLRESFFLPIIWVGHWGGLSLCHTHFRCMSFSLSSGSLSQTGRTNSGDVWAAVSITLTAAALTEFFSTKTLSSFRASSTMLCFLFRSSLRHSRLFFMLSRFAVSTAVASPFWAIKINKIKSMFLGIIFPWRSCTHLLHFLF